MPDLTEQQKRVLVFMDRHGPRWIPLVELDSIKLLDDDDVLTIPSLIELGFVWHIDLLRAVALTPSGTVIADEIRSEQFVHPQPKA